MPHSTLDPNQIQNPSEIPPSGAKRLGLSAGGSTDVYCGTLAGDIDAMPAAQELLGVSPDTAGRPNVDYVYDQVSRLFGGIQLPAIAAASTAKSIAFVSGSGQGGYGAFHMGNTQAELDRLVLDSLTASGSYSTGSGLGAALAPANARRPKGRAFVPEHGLPGLLGVTQASHTMLKSAKKEDIVRALEVANQSVRALEAARRTKRTGAIPDKGIARQIPAELEALSKEELAHELVRANLLAREHVHLAAAAALAGRQYLSTALYAAEIVESFQLAANNADARHTDGEGLSRIVAFKLTPEISLIPGFNSGVTQQWWQDDHPDWVNDNSQDDQSMDGNAAGVMFLLFLNDYLGIPLDQIIAQMPRKGGAPLGETYVNLLGIRPDLATSVGANGLAAFKKMVSLLDQQAKNPDGTLNLPADGNPFPAMSAAKQGGLFTAPATSPGALSQDIQSALSIEAQLEQQVAAVKNTLAQLKAGLTGAPGSVATAVDSALQQMAALPPTVAGLTSLLQKVQGEVPRS